MDVVAVVSLGYVGLPLAVAFGRIMPTIGYDLSLTKLDSYRSCMDPSGIVSEADSRTTNQLSSTCDDTALPGAHGCIVALPTAIDAVKHLDFGPQIGTRESTGSHINSGDQNHALTVNAETLGYHFEVTLAGRLIKAVSAIRGASVSVLGITFNEDVTRMRNCKVWDLIVALGSYGMEVFVHDPVARARLLVKSAEVFAQNPRTEGCFVDVKGWAGGYGLRAAALWVWWL